MQHDLHNIQNLLCNAPRWDLKSILVSPLSVARDATRHLEVVPAGSDRAPPGARSATKALYFWLSREMCLCNACC